MIVRTISLFFALCLVCLHVASAEPSPQMKAAVANLVESQNLETMWPAIIQSSSATGALEVQRGAQEKIDEATWLTPAQRERAYEIIAETAPQIAADLDTEHSRIPVKQVVTEMVFEVYPKYFTAKEIDELARFYRGQAFQRLARLSIEASSEAKRTGKSVDTVMPKYMARMTPQEQEALVRFSNSATGRKQMRVGPALAEEGRAFLTKATEAGMHAVAVKYGEMLRAKFDSEFAELPDTEK